MKAINLIPAHQLLARRRAVRLRLWTAAGALYTLLIGAAVLTLHVSWGSSSRAVADELARVTQEVEQTNKSAAALQPELAEAQLQLEASRAVAVQPDWSVLLALLGSLRGDHVVLNRAVLSPIAPPEAAKAKPAVGPGARPPVVNAAAKKSESIRKSLNFKIEVAGLGKTQSDVSQFVLRLEQSGLFQRVKLVETTMFPFNNENIAAFRIECLMSEGPRK